MGTTNANYKQLYSHITSHMVSQSLDMTFIKLTRLQKTPLNSQETPKHSLLRDKIIMDLIIN